MKDLQFDGVKNGPTWRVTTKIYFIGFAPDVGLILEFIEAAEDAPATTTLFTEACKSVMHPSRMTYLASEIWSYLNLNLIGEALVPFRNVAPHEGFEAWRKVVKLVRSRGEVRRMELTARVQRPAGATKLSDVGKALEAWDRDVR